MLFVFWFCSWHCFWPCGNALFLRVKLSQWFLKWLTIWGYIWQGISYFNIIFTPFLKFFYVSVWNLFSVWKLSHTSKLFSSQWQSNCPDSDNLSSLPTPWFEMEMDSFLPRKEPMVICKIQPNTAFLHLRQQGNLGLYVRPQERPVQLMFPPHPAGPGGRQVVCAPVHEYTTDLCSYISSRMLWADKISEYLAFFFFFSSKGEFLQRVRPSLGVPLEGASTIHIYIDVNMTYVVCVGCTHTRQAAAFSWTIYDMGMQSDF